MEAHGGFPGYYPVVSALVFYPWSALLPAAIAGAWARRKADPKLGYLLGWIVGPLILLECFRTKLIHYYLPAFPSCALLVAWLILSLAAEGVNIRDASAGPAVHGDAGRRSAWPWRRSWSPAPRSCRRSLCGAAARRSRP